MRMSVVVGAMEPPAVADVRPLLLGPRRRGWTVLAVTTAIAEEWGRLNALPQPLPVLDGLMAATAKVHRLVLVTRNVADVARTGIPVNPFEAN